MAELYQMDKEKVKEIFAGDNLEYFKKDVIITKVIDMLYDKAKIKKVKKEMKSGSAKKEEKAEKDSEDK